MKKIFCLIAIIALFMVIPSSVFAQNYRDDTTKYDAKMFGIVSGDYNKKNGIIHLSGMYKYSNSPLSDVKILGQIKYWDFYDTSIPNCFHTFSDDLTIFFDKNISYGKMIMNGLLCNANWSNTWQTLRADYIIIDGKTPSSDGMNGKGVLEITINTKTGQVLSGKINGNIILYT